MSELEIPQSAVQGVADHFLSQFLGTDEAAREFGADTLSAVAPIIVAAELRRIASVYERRADSCLLSPDGRGQEQRVTLLGCADEARSRAAELDPDADV